MTGYTVHTGSTEKFTEGWDNIFSGNSQSAKKSNSKKPAKKKPVGIKKSTARKKKSS